MKAVGINNATQLRVCRKPQGKMRFQPSSVMSSPSSPLFPRDDGAGRATLDGTRTMESGAEKTFLASPPAADLKHSGETFRSRTRNSTAWAGCLCLAFRTSGSDCQTSLCRRNPIVDVAAGSWADGNKGTTRNRRNGGSVGTRVRPS